MDTVKQKEYEIFICGALLHDIGKFFQRTGIRRKHTELGAEFFRECMREALSSFLSPGELDRIEGMISGHHDYEKYITKADWLSAGTERISLDDEETGDPTVQRLVTIFDEVSLFDDEKKESRHVYDLNPLSLNKESLFPRKYLKENCPPDYRKHWENFVKEIKSLRTFGFRHYLNLLYAVLEKYGWCVPSAAYKHEPDISLFDHLKTTSAIAGCLFLHEESDGKGSTPFLLAVGDISGIQSYIYRVARAQGTGGIAKRLRGRSFYLAAFLDLVVYHILWRCGLFKSHILLSSGGRFELLLPNTHAILSVLEETRKKSNDLLLDEQGGEIFLCLEWAEATEDHLKSYSELLDQVETKIQKGKKRKFSHRIFSFTYPQGEGTNIQICPVCGISVISRDQTVCELCEVHKDIGRLLPKAKYIIFSPARMSEIMDNQISYGDLGCIYILTSDPAKKWFEENYFIEVQSINSTDIKYGSTRFLANIAPLATEPFSLDIKGEELEDVSVNKDDVLSFEILADASIGDERIGVLKMDVDHLGLIFSLGLKIPSISRRASLSRLMDLFFGGYLNKLCELPYERWKVNSNWSHKESVSQIFYVVYSGGDDLLVVGPWSEMPGLALHIQKEFKEYVAFNQDINISAGIFICKPKYPVSLAARETSGALETSKMRGRRRITLFEESVEWDAEEKLTFGELLVFGNELFEEVSKKSIPRSFLHKMLAMYKQFDGGKDLRFLPAIKYQLARNIKNKEIMEKLHFALVSDRRGYFKKIRIPVSYAILKSRKEG